MSVQPAGLLPVDVHEYLIRLADSAALAQAEILREALDLCYAPATWRTAGIGSIGNVPAKQLAEIATKLADLRDRG